ncbi:MAG: flagellar assembly protein T N-terminal domain-containing protein [Elusimicrobia bacterium]|nr:flagellar assembly protein T N-terminal domain-containing protein [Elusimicrobiota bacterium]
MKIEKYICIFAFSLFFIAGCGSSRHALKGPAHDTETVEAEGTAPIVSGDIEGAKKTALHEAMRSALGLVVGIYVSGDALVSKAILIDENITSQTEGYIEKYEILKESREGDFYKVKIKAVVRKEDLSAKLRKLESEPQKLGNPVLGFDIEEYIDSKLSDTRYAEIKLKDKFVETGFLTTEEKAKADILVKGRAQSDFNTNQGLGGFISYRASLSLSALKTATGETIATAQDSAGGIDLNRQIAAITAISNAAIKLSEDFNSKILKNLREKSIIHLNLSGVRNMNHISDFVKLLRNIPMIKDCWLRNFSGNDASIDVNVRKGNSSALSDVLAKNQKVPLKIVKSGSYDLEIELQ